jgi:Na+/H+ antiporter NhaC
MHLSKVPPGYTPHIIDFFLPLSVLIVLAIGTFVFLGTPKIRWAFGAALVVAAALAALRGMNLMEIVEGFGEGLKGVVVGSVILLLAVTIGGIAKATGGGNYLVELLGTTLPFWSLPLLLELLTIVIAFSTGTSWGTYAVAFPLAMPLAWAVAQSQGLSNPELYMMLCFAAVMNGSVFGDQCSPISDTTVLSAMCTGGDLMDHVNTQLPQAVQAAALAGVGWTIMAFFCR